MSGVSTKRKFVDIVRDEKYVVLFPSDYFYPEFDYEVVDGVYWIPVSKELNINTAFKKKDLNNDIDFRSFKSGSTSFSFLTEVIWTIFEAWDIKM